ncbi:PDR/VanB family oxidoreductase [Methylibium sp.]|uniref:PDR/VanB family oxidoreductase n=1 Tax=Methylibium sp. TaxID=2067992 RepID=UPI003D115995
MTTNPPKNTLQLEVSNFRSEAKDIVVLELRDRSRNSLPSFTPGSHLEVYLPDGLVRHYSIYNDPTERDRYCLGIGLSQNSRGGSRYIHESIRQGDTLVVSEPRNNFPLVAEAEEYCFIAGGIGITPILSMIKWCIGEGKSWCLYYCVRSRQRAAFYEEIRSLGTPASVHFHFDEEQGGRFFEPCRALQDLSAAVHIYCCGPAPLMNAVQSATQERPEDHVHFEWFSPKSQIQVDHRAFTLVIRSSGRRLAVPPEQSILDVLDDHGISVPYSCREGLCATCQTTVISGIPDHRDSVLSMEQRASNRTMLVCVSRSRSDTLELDL